MEGGKQQSGCLITLEQICHGRHNQHEHEVCLRIQNLNFGMTCLTRHVMDNGTPYPMPTSPLDDHNIHGHDR